MIRIIVCQVRAELLLAAVSVLMLSYVIVFLFGAVIGSFLNVCIYRLPREESVAWPASPSLPAADRGLRQYSDSELSDLAGTMPQMPHLISIQYPLVEAANAPGMWRSFGCLDLPG